jgi:hypothetical protein
MAGRNATAPGKAQDAVLADRGTAGISMSCRGQHVLTFFRADVLGLPGWLTSVDIPGRGPGWSICFRSEIPNLHVVKLG